MTMRHWADSLTGMPHSPRNPVGRPRAVRRGDASADPKEDILRAAAALFVRQGFAGTSTRVIAELAGMRQASLYYYFSGKDDILRALLAETVHPTLDKARELQATADPDGDPAVGLYRLVVADATILLEAGRHVGALYSLPEVWSGSYPEFVKDHASLESIYTGWCRALAAGTAVTFPVASADLGRLCCRLVESSYEYSGDLSAVADTLGCLALRLNGVSDARIESVRVASRTAS